MIYNICAILASRLELELKEKIYSQYPEYKNNLEWDILLTVLIQGNFHAFLSHSKDINADILVDLIGNINEKMISR